jgi:transposase-like protein
MIDNLNPNVLYLIVCRRVQMISNELKSKALSLRVENKKSLKEISQETGISKATLSVFLRDHPLPDEELKNRAKVGHGLLKSRAKQLRDTRLGEKSKFLSFVKDDLTRQDKSRISEAAVAFRLALLGLPCYSATADGEKFDMVVEHPAKGFLKIQVKTVKQSSHGMPVVSLCCTEGHNKSVRYGAKDFDYIVGYNLVNDTAYVFSVAEVSHLLKTVSISEKNAEAWDKLNF